MNWRDNHLQLTFKHRTKPICTNLGHYHHGHCCYRDQMIPPSSSSSSSSPSLLIQHYLRSFRSLKSLPAITYSDQINSSVVNRTKSNNTRVRSYQHWLQIVSVCIRFKLKYPCLNPYQLPPSSLPPNPTSHQRRRRSNTEK